MLGVPGSSSYNRVHQAQNSKVEIVERAKERKEAGLDLDGGTPSVSGGKVEPGMVSQILLTEAESLNLSSDGHWSSEVIDLEQEGPPQLIQELTVIRPAARKEHILSLRETLGGISTAHQACPSDVFLMPER